MLNSAPPFILSSAESLGPAVCAHPCASELLVKPMISDLARRESRSQRPKPFAEGPMGETTREVRGETGKHWALECLKVTRHWRALGTGEPSHHKSQDTGRHQLTHSLDTNNVSRSGAQVAQCASSLGVRARYTTYCYSALRNRGKSWHACHADRYLVLN